MQYKVLKAEHNGLKFKIEEYVPDGAAYLSGYEDGECFFDYLQDNIDMCKKLAFEKHGVPLEIWIEKKENKNILDYIILFSASTLAFTILDLILEINFGTSIFEFSNLDITDIWPKLIIFVCILQIVGIITSLKRLKTVANRKTKFFIRCYLLLTILFFLFMFYGYLVGSSMNFHQPY